MPTLCIVDMQPKFSASEHILAQVIWQIEQAKQNRHNIVILEYYGSDRTHSALRNVLKGYKRKVYVTKYDDDGSMEFAEAAHRNKFGISTVIVVGVNRGWCVRETVAGLMEHGKVHDILVVKDATWGNNPEAEMDQLEYLAHHPCNKVKIV